MHILLIIVTHLLAIWLGMICTLVILYKRYNYGDVHVGKNGSHFTPNGAFDRIIEERKPLAVLSIHYEE